MLQVLAARDIARGILGHLEYYDCYFKIFRSKHVLHFKRLEFICFLKFSIFYVELFKSFMSLI